MSEQEQNAVVGDLTRQYSNAKRSRDLIKEKLRSYGSELEIVGERLKSGAFSNADTLLRMQVVQEFGLEKLKSLLAEHSEHERTVDGLRERLRSLHVNVG